MKKVEFVRVNSQWDGAGLIKGSRYTFDIGDGGIEKIIKERLEAGWQYLGYVPINERTNGETETLSLIFQMEE